jgi:hypothetical protein
MHNCASEVGRDLSSPLRMSFSLWLVRLRFTEEGCPGRTQQHGMNMQYDYLCNNLSNFGRYKIKPCLYRRQ